MKNTELHNWMRGRHGEQLEKRLVWNAEVGATEAPKSLETIDTSKELPKGKLDALTDRIKDLTLKNAQVDIDLKGSPNAVKLRQALNKEVGQIANDLKIKNIDLYLMNGLLENIGKVDKLPSKSNLGGMTDLTMWMQRNNIAKFTIDQGFWKFFDAKGVPIQAEYKMDQPAEKPEDKIIQAARDKVAKMATENPNAEKQTEMAKIIKDNNLLDSITLPTRFKGNKQNFIVELEQGKLTKTDFAELNKLVPPKKPATEKKETVAISSDVAKKKVADTAADTATEADRLKLENLGKVTSSAPVELSDCKTVDDVSKLLALSLKDKNDNFPIQASEMKTTLTDYIKGIPGKEGAEQFSNFVKKLAVEQPYLNQIAVENGKIVFKSKEDPTKSTSNPLNLGTRNPNGKNGERDMQDLYAHVNLRDAAVSKQEAANAEAAKKTADEKDKPNPKLAATEKEIQKLLKQPESTEMPVVDARYLAAFTEMLKFDPATNVPVKFNIPFNNDKGMDCSMFRNANGTYILKYGLADAKGDMKWQPSEGAIDPKGEAIKFFAEQMNSGMMLEQIQRYNVRSKENFATFNIPIADGPNEVGGKVEYKLGWDTGAFEKNPHILIQPLAHGEIQVQVKKSGIGFSNEEGANNDELTFVAGGFQDMTRILHSLQQWHENPNKDNPEAQTAEKQRRYLTKGVLDLQGDIGDLKSGTLLSVNSMASTVDSKLIQGYSFRFDWMETQEPPQILQMVKDAKGFEVKMVPSGQVLGHVEEKMPEGFKDAMRMVAEQREIMMTTGGPEKAKANVRRLIDGHNELRKILGNNAVVLSGKVNILGFHKGLQGQNLVTLGMDDMKGVTFDFSSVSSDVPGMAEAVKQGYLIEGNAEAVKALSDGKTKGDTKAPVESAGTAEIGVEKSGAEAQKGPKKAADGKDKPVESDINVLRKDSDKSSDILPEAKAKITRIVEKIGINNKQNVGDYLRAYFVGITDVEKVDNAAAIALRDFAKVDKGYLNDNFSDNSKKIDYLIGVINKPKSQIDAAKDKSDATDLEKRFTNTYKDYPKALNVIKANIKILEHACRKNESAKDKVGDKDFQADYSFKLEEAVAKKLGELKEKTGVRAVSIDKDLAEFLIKYLKNAATEGIPEWNKALDAQKVAKDAAEKSQSVEELKGRVTKPNGVAFTAIEKQQLMSVLGAQAYSVMEASTAIVPPTIKKENIFLSKTPDNSLGNTDRVSWNIKAGPDGQQKPYTINFRTMEAGQTIAQIAPGWNNVEVRDQPWADTKDATIPDKIAHLVNGFNGAEKKA